MISLLLTLLIVFLVAGFVIWVISLIPLPGPWSRVAQALVALIVLIWLLGWLVPGLAHLR